LAQILAMRYEILPERYCREFSNLFDRVRPLAEKEIRSVFLQEFGKFPENIFQRFSYEPLASASFGQVHSAILDGQKVAVKVQRPGVSILAEADTAILKGLSVLVGVLFVTPVNLQDAMREWENWTRRELDYRKEADSAVRLRNLSTYTDIYIPKVYKNISTSRILIMEFLEGVNLNEVMQRNIVELSPAEKKVICRKIVRGLLLDYFKSGFFHADPHPGNIIILKNGGLSWVDFGIMGEGGSASQGYHFANFIKYSSEESVSRAVSHLKDFMNGLKLGIGAVDLKFNWRGKSPKRIARGIMKFLDYRLGKIIKRWALHVIDPKVGLAMRSTARHFLDLISEARGFGMEIPTNLLSFIRSVVITDMVCLVLDPQFNMKEELHLFFEDYPEICNPPDRADFSSIKSPVSTLIASRASEPKTVNLDNSEEGFERKGEEKQRILERYIEQASRIMERILEEGSRGLAYFATTKI